MIYVQDKTADPGSDRHSIKLVEFCDSGNSRKNMFEARGLVLLTVTMLSF